MASNSNIATKPNVPKGNKLPSPAELRAIVAQFTELQVSAKIRPTLKADRQNLVRMCTRMLERKNIARMHARNARRAVGTEDNAILPCCLLVPVHYKEMSGRPNSKLVKARVADSMLSVEQVGSFRERRARTALPRAPWVDDCGHKYCVSKGRREDGLRKKSLLRSMLLPGFARK